MSNTAKNIRSPKNEAQEFIDANLAETTGLEAYVLEPSPPAQNEPPLFADIPTEITGDPQKALTPTSAGGHTYNDFPELSEFCAERWLGHWRALPPLPDNWLEKLEDAHRLAFSVVSEARRLNNGKFGLRWVMGGFGTPFFGDDIQVRVVEGSLVLQKAGEVKVEPVTNLKSAGAFLDMEPSESQREHDSPELGDMERQLQMDATTNHFLGEWFGFTTSILEELKLRGGNAVPVQIWPGHFDVATELDGGKNRSTFGASPGDRAHTEPYLYIGPHIEVDTSEPFWNAESFGGASLALSEIVAAGNSGQEQREKALGFYEMGLELIKNQ